MKNKTVQPDVPKAYGALNNHSTFTLAWLLNTAGTFYLITLVFLYAYGTFTIAIFNVFKIDSEIDGTVALYLMNSVWSFS